ncbi:MAG: NADH-ubiquinone oxidoreductase-F iron-sulfur binding region domain-containing protein [Actinomycetes bacterium]
MSDVAPTTSTQRLLAGASHGSTIDLDQHIATHGDLTLPDRGEAPAWRSTMLDELDRSGLTGRGGGGFPTGRKLRALDSSRRRRIMVINTMEGEPAAQKDSVLAGFAPHLILDGAEVLATVIDAASIVVAVARDNPSAGASLEAAVTARRSAGRGSFDISIVTPPGRYVAGEESALAHWIDGGASLPTFRAAKPAVLRAKGRTVVIDNAETTAHCALIARRGATWFREFGTADAPGTALVTMSGAVESPGVFEVALGTPLREVLALAGANPKPTGILLGGYGGAFVGPSALDAPYSPDGLRPFGASPGAGVIIVLDERSCGIAEAARITRWMANESAGQCGPCVFGLPALASDLASLASSSTKGRINSALARHLTTIEGRGACAHPDGVVRMVRSALDVFSLDVAAHTRGNRCAGAHAPSLLALPPNDGDIEWR